MAQEDDSIIIDQAKNGDEVAFTELYNKYKEFVRITILNIIKNVEITNDLTSIVFIKIFEKLNTYVNNISFKMWIKTVAVNTAIDYIRSKKNELLQNVYIDADDNVIQIEDKELDPELETIKSENLSQLEIALSKLRANYRKLIELRYFHNLSYKEISSALGGTPVGTIKSDLHKAKKRLRKIFSELSQKLSDNDNKHRNPIISTSSNCDCIRIC